MATVKIPSLGREAQLGDLYDASAGRFWSANIFVTLPTECTVTIDKQCVHRNAHLIRKPSDKLSLFGISKDEQMNLIDYRGRSIKGSAAFLFDEATNQYKTAFAIYTKRISRTCTVNLVSAMKCEAIRIESVHSTRSATHVLVGIEYGLSSVAFSPCSITDATAEQHIRVLLQEVTSNGEDAQAAVVGLDRIAQEHGNIVPKILLYSEFEKTEMADFQSCFGVVANDCGQCRVPLEFTLLPVEFFLELLCRNGFEVDFSEFKSTSFKRISQAVTENVLSALDDVILTRHQLIYYDAENLLRIERLHERLQMREYALRREVQSLVSKVRVGEEDEDKLRLAGKEELDKWRDYVDRCASVIVKRRYAKDHNLQYIDTEASLEKFASAGGTRCVIFCELSNPRSHGIWAQFMAIGERNRWGCAFVDLEADQSLEGYREGVRLYVDGLVVEKDVLRLKKLLTVGNVIKFDRKAVLKQVVSEKCEVSLVVRLKCPCDSEKTPMKCVCYECCSIVGYNLRGRFCCDCGKTPVPYARIMCDGERHGLRFKEGGASFHAQLPQWRDFKQVTVIFLSETGAGKSTMINALSNYVVFDNLADADKSPLRYLIPTQFIIEDSSHEQHIVRHGSSPYEVFVEGQSSTTKINCYEIAYEKHILKLIDVPGLGDLRDSEKDEKNFRLILEEIMSQGKVHGVCILLPPNSSRLSTTLHYCISELNARLPVSAANNVIFCLTKTRQTFYRIGDTIGSVQQLLKEYELSSGICVPFSNSNTFCYDNEAFRYLCAKKAGVKFCDEEEAMIAESYHKSRIESMRFLRYIFALQPFSTSELPSLNEA